MTGFEFPGKYYDIIRADFRDIGGETDFLAGLLPDRGRVLDLGCGTGTNLRALHERGFTGVGVDASSEFVRSAKAAGVDGLEFVHATLPEFDTSEQFDLVLCVFATLNLLPHAELATLLGKVSTWLRPGGTLVVEAGHLLNFVDSYQPFMIWHHEADGVLITRLVRTSINAHTANWRNEETLMVRTDDGAVSMYRNFFDQFVLTAPELRGLLHDAGFEITAEYGSFRGTSPPPFGKGPLIQVARAGEQRT